MKKGATLARKMYTNIEQYENFEVHLKTTLELFHF